jgi:hypothetical protein
MTFDVVTERLPDYIRMTVAGEASIKDFVDLVLTTEQETALWSDRRAMVDLRQIKGRLDPAEQVFLGELVAQNLAHLERVASVVPADQITRNSENAAQKLGMQLRVFASDAEAAAWLTTP